MKLSWSLPAAALAILIAASAGGWYFTRDTAAPPAAAGPARDSRSLIDQRLVQTSQSMAAQAATPPEQDLAREALRLTDHELDQAYATALREVTAPPPPATGPLRDLAARVSQASARVAAGRERVAALAKKASSSEDAAARLELAKAQLALSEDELEDASQDLARQGGDERARLQRALEEHENAQHQQSGTPRFPPAPATADTLGRQLQAWFELRALERGLEQARRQAADKAATLERAHDALEHSVTAKTNAAPADDEEAGDAEETADIVARLRNLSDQRKTLTELDHRIDDCRQLADVYSRWGGILQTRRRAVVHLVMASLAAVFAILLVAVLLHAGIYRALATGADRRAKHQLRVMAGLAVEVLAAVLILLVIFGPPTQVATLLGFATAGLTVVMKDFIVSFVGWFALMGKNGIRLGDFVEIKGVGGEVIEIGVLRTVLLEMGTWTEKGHPTGRRVTFANTFAIEGQYFNFSTSGQWLWDDLTVALPPGREPYATAQQIREIVDRETAQDAAQAETEWQRVTHQYGTRPFSARPSADVRPSATGLEVVVRYITRAPQRYHVKSRLFDAIVSVLHVPAAARAET